MRPFLLLCLLFAFTSPGRTADLKVATWNLNWLTSRAEGLPADVRLRQPEDFDRLRGYAAELHADIVALQEVDGAASARLLFPSDDWSIHMSRDHVRQRVGIAVRRGQPYKVNPDVTAIALAPEAHLRSGVDITLKRSSGDLRVLAVHLKTGCQYAEPGRDPRPVCQTLLTQFEVVAAWIAARRVEGAAFAVLGDFNRGLDQPDIFSAKLRDAAPVTRVTEGFSSPCWGHQAFIDHILLGGPARDWVVPGALRVLVYRESGAAWPERLSDHCPVSVRLHAPD